MLYTLSGLAYGYNALEPYIDTRTMEIHYTKHHQGYTDKLNGVLEKYPKLQSQSVEELLKAFSSLEMEEKDKAVFRNNGGGYTNHTLFWEIMGPKKMIDEALKAEVEKVFGSVNSFREQFSAAAVSHFGSGWAWLVRTAAGKLQVYSLPNQDSPYLKGDTPIIGLDVWEHAYYLNYQNRRQEYVEKWWNVLKLL
ncbi:MAG: superoxide dismutase [Candidatus Portnoybacteria bacterium]|nr:superoxide dismutase [Candidatus Portnoybacteria bacterium]